MSTNVAAAANGGTASASSTQGSGYLPAFAINGDRTGAVWGTNGGWNDNTPNTFDDWLEVDFNASYAITEIDLFGLQDAYTAPTTPTLTMTSSLYGLRYFNVQYWNGSGWIYAPGGAVSGNTHVWVQILFASPITTTAIRVLVHDTQDSTYSRIVELEAWTAPAAPGAPTTPNPASGASGIALAPLLSWAGAAGATSFDVYFGTSGSPPLVNAGQAGWTYMPAALAGSTTYFWQIVARNTTGTTAGAVWSFTTLALAAGTSIMPTPLVEAELNGVGGGWTNLSADVLRASGLLSTTGIRASGPADLVASTGTATFTLNNSAKNMAGLLGYYSLYHANKRAGWALGINCRIRYQDPNTGSYYPRFVGRVDAIDPAPGVRLSRAVLVTVADWLDEAARWTLTPAIGPQVGQTGDQIMTAILAQMPRQPTATAFDVGVEPYAYALDTSASTGQPALTEFAKLAASEFGPIYQRGDGTLRYESRHARLLSTVSAWTITEAMLQDLHLPSTRDEIINVVRVVVHKKIVDPVPTTKVYVQANVIDIAAGATKLLLGAFRNPVTGDPIGATGILPQVAGVDYIAWSNADGTGTNYSAGLVVAVTIGPSGAQFNVTNNNAGTAYLTTNQLLGRGIYDHGTLQLQATDSISVAAVGEHSVTFDMPYQDNADVGQGAANYILGKYSSAFAQARTIRVIARTPALLAQVLTRDISDRITISETVTGLNSDYFINGIALSLLPSGHAQADYTLAPAADPLAGLYWILGTSVLGAGTLPAPF